MKRFKKLLSIFSIFTLLFGINMQTNFTLNACSSVAECDDALAQLEQDIANAEAKLKDAQDNESNLREQIKAINEKITLTNQQIETLESTIATLEIEIETKENEIAEKDAIIVEQLKVQQKQQNSNTFLSLLMSANSLSDLMNRISVLETLSSREKELLDELAVIKAELETDKQKQEEQKTTLEQTKTDLESTQAEKLLLQEEMKTLIAEEEANLNSLAASESEIEAQREILNRPIPEEPGTGATNPGNPTNGAWHLPVDAGAVITARLWSPTYQWEIGSPHRGTDIGMYYGASIYSIASGWVLAAGNYGALGNLVAVGHNVNGVYYVSAYAHLSAISVSVGQSVAGGQKIGAMGGSGYGNPYYYATHLHIEFAQRDYFTTSIAVRNATNIEVLNVLPWQGYWSENADAW